MDSSVSSGLTCVSVMILIIILGLVLHYNWRKTQVKARRSEGFDCGAGCVSLEKQKPQSCFAPPPKMEEQKDLPLRTGSRMGGPAFGGNDSCAETQEEQMKLSLSNPYGKMYPEGSQMYGQCVAGTNPFDFDEFS